MTENQIGMLIDILNQLNWDLERVEMSTSGDQSNRCRGVEKRIQALEDSLKMSLQDWKDFNARMSE